MPVPNETLKAMIIAFHGFELSDDELELIRPELDAYLTEIERLREIDLSGVFSGRLLKVDEGGAADA